MSWLRTGDTAAFYPPLMLTITLPGSDERTVNEVMGFIVRCMAQAASQRSDYLIDMGTVGAIGQSRTAELLKICKKVKLLKAVKRDGLDYIQVIDDPNFLHVRLRAEQDAENQRKRDNGNPSLTAPVRLRDGDFCRWCGVVTYWGTPDQKSGRAGTYDHLVPVSAIKDGVVPKATVSTMVVACRSCNSSRQNDRDGWTRELLDPPNPPYFSRPTADFIAKHLGVQVVTTDQRPAKADHAQKRPVIQPDPAPSEPTASGPTHHAADDAANGTDDLSAAVLQVQDQLGGTLADRPIPADPSHPVSGNVGSGRDGPGWAGSGRDRASPGDSPPPRRKRSARGRPR